MNPKGIRAQSPGLRGTSYPGKSWPKPTNPKYVFSALVGMARCAVPARVVAGGTNIRATLAFEGVAPLHAARTSQRDVPTTLNTYNPNGVASHFRHRAATALELKIPSTPTGPVTDAVARGRASCSWRLLLSPNEYVCRPPPPSYRPKGR